MKFSIWEIYQQKNHKKEAQKQYKELVAMHDRIHEELESRKFQVKWLEEMYLGNVEGERDKKLESSFLKTQAIREIITGDYNYVLAPKGCGKSSLFKAYSDRYKAIKQIQDSQRCIIVSINNAFSFENALNNKNLSDRSSDKRWAIFWGIYLIREIFREITKPEYSIEFSSFLKKSKQYEEIKQEFNLYDIWDYINNIKTAITFNLQGQQISVSPSIRKETIKKSISLNSVFKDLQDYLMDHAIELYILIDRIDDFVVGEKFDKQRKYIQGLYNCVEEIGQCENINPLLFLRTDLYQYLKIGTGSDKIQTRTINLEWTKSELIDFVCIRLLNCSEPLQWYKKMKYIYCMDEICKAASRGNIADPNQWGEYDLGIISKCSQKIIYTFFPQKCTHITADGNEENIEFVDWMYTHFEDYTKYINLRYLMLFFNKLFKKQFENYCKQLQNTRQIDITYDGKNDQYSYTIFSNRCIQQCYEEVQEIAIKNVKSLIQEYNEQKCFEEIHERTVEKRGVWSFGDLNYRNYDMTKEDYSTLLERLVILGYFKETGKKFLMPILYMHHLKK